MPGTRATLREALVQRGREGLRLQARDPRAAVGRVLTAGRQRHAQLLHRGQSHAGCQMGFEGKKEEKGNLIFCQN